MPAEPETVTQPLVQHEYDLAANGKTFLLAEADRASLLLLGELHGDREVPALIRELWPALWRAGYRQVAAEVSPWRADRLEHGRSGGMEEFGSWTQAEAAFVSSFAKRKGQVLWGCDMEELRVARYPETVFDLRPMRGILHRIPEGDRSPALKSLVYWTDSYDAVICYRQVNPAAP